MLLEETKKRMQRLYEFTYLPHGVTEDGDPNQDPNGGMPPAGGAPMGGGDPNAMGGAPGGDPNGGMPPAGGDPMGGGDPNAMGGAPGADPMGGGMPPAGGADPMGGDPNGGMPPAGPDAGDIDGANLAPNAGMDDPMMGGDPMGGAQPGPDDDVIDISQLTDAQDELKQNQEQTAEQLQDVDDKLTTLMQVVDKFTKALDANDQKINDLKQELVKRTPTEEETMNVRLNAGGNPFDQKPEEFWDKFEDINNHYNITANNEAPQYQIKKGDIDNINDRMIDSEFDEFDDIPKSLHEYFVR